jgi:hypothetical protein
MALSTTSSLCPNYTSDHSAWSNNCLMANALKTIVLLVNTNLKRPICYHNENWKHCTENSLKVFRWDPVLKLCQHRTLIRSFKILLTKAGPMENAYKSTCHICLQTKISTMNSGRTLIRAKMKNLKRQLKENNSRMRACVMMLRIRCLST